MVRKILVTSYLQIRIFSCLCSGPCVHRGFFPLMERQTSRTRQNLPGTGGYRQFLRTASFVLREATKPL